MLALPDLQEAFRRALLAGEEEPLPDGLEDAIEGDGLSASARVAIYRHHVVVTLTAVLKAAYPVVCRLVDERFFDYAAHCYVRDHPPSSPCLFEYGASLPEFLETFPPCRELVYLADVARLEWAIHAAGYAPDAKGLDPAALCDLGADQVAHVALELSPSLALVSSPWPIDRIWRANQPEADPEATIDLGAGGVRLEVRRRGEAVTFRAVDDGDHAFRGALRAGRPLAEATSAALDADPRFDIAAALRDLLADDAVVGFTATASR
jgi:Putative DNA-binding domain